MTIISSDILKAVEILSNEDVVAIPTETVYGLAGNIYSEKAINRIFEVKQRPLFNPLIVHLHSAEQLNDLVTEFPQKATVLADHFWPGPLTLILKKSDSIPDKITAGKDTVGVRIPNHPVTLELLKSLPFPLAAPSANPFNRISPTQAKHVEDYFQDQIKMVLEGGECQRGLESTIIGFPKGEPVIYRFGSIALEDIENVIGPVQVKNKSIATPDAPGMLAKHYAPMTKTILVDNLLETLDQYRDQNIGVIKFSGSNIARDNVHTVILSANADLSEAASVLYSGLHKLDRLGLDIIIAERLPDEGLGKSMNDRLERATK